MVPADVVTAWAITHPWPARTQVEQDLLLSQAICEIANHPYLGAELVFRGGTALHKLHMAAPYRYSEDLDYVRSTSSGIAPLTRALTEVGERLGYVVRTRISEHPKVYWRCTSASGTPLRIKVEVNTHETSPALTPLHIEHAVDTEWWSGSAAVRTFQPPELVATKVRALYQRSKGRDVFDLWLAIHGLGIDPDAIIDAFAPYRPGGWTPKLAEQNLRRKLADPTYGADLLQLVANPPADFAITDAAELLLDRLIRRVPPV